MHFVFISEARSININTVKQTLVSVHCTCDALSALTSAYNVMTIQAFRLILWICFIAQLETCMPVRKQVSTQQRVATD